MSLDKSVDVKDGLDGVTIAGVAILMVLAMGWLAVDVFKHQAEQFSVSPREAAEAERLRADSSYTSDRGAWSPPPNLDRLEVERYEARDIPLILDMQHDPASQLESLAVLGSNVTVTIVWRKRAR